jgi:hypothetical protein
MTDHDPHILGPGQAPTPFTADEIRQGCPPGRTIRLLVELNGAEPFVRINRFTDCDAHGATLERMRLGADGEPMDPVEAHRSTWLELQAHASFPADRSTIVPETIEIPIGVLECLRYTVTDGSSVETFWFAKSAPGMPVKVVGREAGRVTGTVTMIDDRVVSDS